MYKPSWRQYEKDMRSDNPDKAVKSTDSFISERDSELKNDVKARKWEKSRRDRANKDKKVWVKGRLKDEEKQNYDNVIKPFKDLLEAGEFDSNIHPSPGYVVVKVDRKPDETETVSGIIVQAEESAPNTGIVIEAGSKLYCKHCFTHPHVQPTEPPCKIGDYILFKKGAGLSIDIKGVKCHLMVFSDVLALIENGK